MIHEVYAGIDDYLDYLSNGKLQSKKNSERYHARKQREPHECPICGKLTTRMRYCSNECQAEGRKLWRIEYNAGRR